jgi:hypothetical protein
VHPQFLGGYSPGGMPRRVTLRLPALPSWAVIASPPTVLAFGQRVFARGFVHLSPENREKSRSVVQTVAPCSSAIAARTASMMSGPTACPSRTRLHRMSQCRSPGSRNPGGGLAEPGGNRRFGFGRGQRTFEHAGICRNPEKGPQRKPGEANEIRPREHGFEPGSAFLVLLCPRMVGIEQQVCVDEDHR